MATSPNTPASELIASLQPRRRVGFVAVTLVTVILAAGGGLYAQSHRAPSAPPYVTGVVTRGDVTESIQATGTVQPLLQVQVGTQVSGRVQALHADFNSRVHRGDLLAEIDPTPFRAAVDQQEASVHAAEATVVHSRADLVLQQRNLERATQLRTQNLNAPADLDAARAARDDAQAQLGVAQAQLAQAQAELRSAQTNLEYTRIFAPIDGVVITRSVDVGQTVAASLQAPVLFVIANDLTQMQVVADVDEADVGRLQNGLNADAHVDAFPNDDFQGSVSQVRYGSTTTQGVVTYPAVINVANTAEKLRPGMTATVTVVTAQHDNVLRVPNAALRFRPATPTRAAASASRPRPTVHSTGASGRIYVLQNGTAVPVSVRVGLTDGAYTEVSAPSLAEGSRVIVDQTDAAAAAPATAAPTQNHGSTGMRRMP